MQIIHRLHRFSQRDKLGGGVNKSAQSASSADQKKALSPSPAWFFYLRGFVPLCEKI
jgi:hypothetical protein